MNILLLGKTGQVGKSILNLNNSKYKIFAFDRDEMPLNKQEELSKNLSEALKKNNIDFLINAAAFTDVNEAEEKPNLAYEVNSNALLTITNELKKNLKKKSTVLIHFSTDYVFDGSGNKAWSPNSKTNPLNIYGKSKIRGEEIIRGSEVPAIILRTSWVFSKNGNNFLKKILKKIKENEFLKIVDDQVGSPTSSDFISSFCMHILDNQHLHNKLGTYHLTAKGTTSWFGFANLIIQNAIKKGIIHHNSSKKIIPIQSTCFDSKANRPKNSHLDCKSLEEDFNFYRTTWQNQTDDVLDQIILDIK